MSEVGLEHINITVTDPDKIARILCDLFDWRIRWSGPAREDGYTVHVGTNDCYIALYRPAQAQLPTVERYTFAGSLSHIGVVIDDLQQTEERVLALGLKPHSHADYSPGKRFYVDLPDHLEVEVVSYVAQD